MLTAGEPLPAMFLEDLGGGHAINKKEIYWKKPDNTQFISLYAW
jgi:hypothetical protein